MTRRTQAPIVGLGEQITVRPCVAAFARAMEARLQAKDAKRGDASWRDGTVTSRDLVRGLVHQFSGLIVAIKFGNGVKTQKKAVDLANYAMIVFDLETQWQHARRRELDATDPSTRGAIEAGR